MSSPRIDTPSAGSPAQAGWQARDDGFVSLQGQPLALPPKERAVLHLLVRRWPDVVAKEEFAASIWRGQAMSDESLARCVAQLRRLLPAAPGLAIQAVYGTGYRLELPAAAPATAEATRHAATLAHARQLVYQRTPAGLLRAEQLLRDLLAQSPRDAAAQVALAECLASAVASGLAVQREALAQAQQALAQIAPPPAGLHATVAHLLDCQWRFTEAAPLHARAAAGADDEQGRYWRGWHLLSTGRAGEAAQALSAAADLNPFSVRIGVLLARCLAACGEVERGLIQAERLAELAPDSLAAQVYLLGYHAYTAPAPALADEARRVLVGPASWAFAASTLAYVFARCGEPGLARQVMQQMRGTPGQQANAIAALLCLGAADEAMDSALAAAAQGCGQLPLLLVLPENAALARHAGFPGLGQAIRRWDRNPAMAELSG